MKSILLLALVLVSGLLSAVEAHVPGLDAYRAKMQGRLERAADKQAKDAVMADFEKATIQWAKSLDMRPAAPKKDEDPRKVSGVNEWLERTIARVVDPAAEEHKPRTKALALFILNNWPGFNDPAADYIKYKGPLPAWPVM